MKEKLNFAILKRIWREHTRKYIWLILGISLLTAMIAAVEAYAVSLLKPVFDTGFEERNSRALSMLCVQIVILYIVKGWMYYAQTRSMSYVTTKTICSIQDRVFSHLLSLNIGFFNRTSSGQMLSRIISDCASITQIAITFITGVFKDLVTCAAMFAIMVYYSWKMCLVIFVFVPVGVLLIRRISTKAKEITKQATQMNAAFVAKLAESFQNIKVIKSYCMERYEGSRIRSMLDSLFDFSMQNNRNQAAVSPVIETLSGFIIAGIIVFGGHQVSAGALTTGGFVTFLGAWVSVYKPLKSLIKFRVQLQMALVSAERVYEIIDVAPEIRDAKGAVELKNVKGDIEFRDVSFGYESSRPVLAGINLKIGRGQTVALVGPSGGGKSTIASLIPRFFDVSGGAILVDGVDIRDATQKSLRQATALVSQEVLLFDDTIENNIKYGAGDRSAVKAKDVEKAARLANAEGFIAATPNGYKTMVGERGVNLSGGQKQRISIARALIKNAPILLLDEATSALDTESEHEVQSALDNLMKDRTTIVIAHRLSTITGADRICVVERGRIVEEGTHAELLKKKGEYAKLYKMQFKDEK
ncbi:MAG: ATP-binding cassette domain-containing protein [Rickettsiales bacterium]|jgi:subfamily B ATP-binding cassette protein MsbA|nr:ATP-binding cassette domain-containing protein [Rickettsiales bacterium]